MLDPQGRFIYALWFSFGLIAAVLILGMGFTVTLAAISPIALPLFLAISGALSRRIGRPRLASTLEGVAIIYGGSFILMFALFPMTALGGPFADEMLSNWDRKIGFDWHAYLELCRPVTRVLLLAYNSFAWQPSLIVIGLVVTRRENRLWQFLLAVFFASVITTLVYPFFPARAPFAFYDITPEMYPELIARGTRDFLPRMEAIRNGTRLISPEIFTGVVAFPSFHASTAIIFSWALWPFRRLRWLGVFLNLMMIASTPVIGNHYFVDVLAGMSSACLAILLAVKLAPPIKLSDKALSFGSLASAA